MASCFHHILRTFLFCLLILNAFWHVPDNTIKKKIGAILEICLQRVWKPCDIYIYIYIKKKEKCFLLAISQHVVVIQRQGITTTYSVIAQRSAILIYFVAKAWNHASCDLLDTYLVRATATADVLQLTSTKVENKVCLLQLWLRA